MKDSMSIVLLVHWYVLTGEWVRFDLICLYILTDNNKIMKTANNDRYKGSLRMRSTE